MINCRPGKMSARINFILSSVLAYLASFCWKYPTSFFLIWGHRSETTCYIIAHKLSFVYFIWNEFLLFSFKINVRLNLIKENTRNSSAFCGNLLKHWYTNYSAQSIKSLSYLIFPYVISYPVIVLINLQTS